jgi:transcriptional regulator with XRE-family HTH domain
MEGEKLRGIAFRRRRVSRGLSTAQVAETLRIPRRNIVAFEEGIIMQLPRDAQEKIASLNTKWTSEDIGNYHLRRVG